jgi:hypothetical protein
VDSTNHTPDSGRKPRGEIVPGAALAQAVWHVLTGTVPADAVAWAGEEAEQR